MDGVTYTQGWDQENRLVWASTGGVTTTFTYDANGALVKKEDPLVGATYYVGPHYEVLVPAVILPPAPADLVACHASGSPPNVCNDLTWTGSLDVTYSVYRSTTSPVPIDAGHLVTSGLTETNYTDCGNVYKRYYAVTAVNENGESAPSNEDRASESCGSAAALTLPVLNAAALTESGGEPVITKYYFAGGKRVAMDREGVVQWLVGDHLGTTSLVLDDQGSVVAESRHYPYGEERWRWPQEGTFPTEYRFTGQRSESGLGLVHMGARFYDSQLGRWLSADTIVPEPANPQSLNRYSWVLGNPLGYTDPSGHCGVHSGNDYEDGCDPGWELKALGLDPGLVDWVNSLPWGLATSADDDIIDLFFDFLLQHGPDTRLFGEETFMAEALKDNPGIAQALEEHEAAHVLPGVTKRYYYDFDGEEFIDATRRLDGAGHFLGSYEVFVTEGDSGVMHVRVVNKTDRASGSNLRTSDLDISLQERLEQGTPLGDALSWLVYGKPVEAQWKTIFADHSRNQTCIGGDYVQYYVWTIEEW